MRHGKHLLSFLIGAVSEILVVRTSAVQEIRGYSQPVPSTAFLRQQLEPKKQDKGPTGSITTRLSTPEPTLTPRHAFLGTERSQHNGIISGIPFSSMVLQRQQGGTYSVARFGFLFLQQQSA
jgi:hypothetical protein